MKPRIKRPRFGMGNRGDQPILERQPEGPHLSIASDASGRHAILKDDGYSAWLYLTHQSNYEVTATVLVYSRVTPRENREAPLGQNSPPLLLRQFASPAALQKAPDDESVRLQFSADGNSAIVLLRSEPWAFVTHDRKQGCSKSLSAASPFGSPWDAQLYEELFHQIRVD